MAAPALKAELKHKDGKTTCFAVEAENNLKSLIAGVKKLNAEISVVLTGLVEEEKCLRGDSRVNDLEEDDDDEEEKSDVEEDKEKKDEEQNATENKAVKPKPSPPAKRLKTETET